MKLKCKKFVQECQKTLYSINWNLLVEISKNNTFSVPQAFKTADNSYALKSSTLKTYKSHEVFFETLISDFGFKFLSGFEAAKDYVVDLKSRVKSNLRSSVTDIIMFFNLSNAP
jgi:SUMO ligase MMS21 Smc5/6 complex component